MRPATSTSTHRHRRAKDVDTNAFYCDPGWRWSRPTATSLLSPRHEPPLTYLESSLPHAEKDVAGDYSSHRVRTMAATYGTHTAQPTATRRALMPPMLSGQHSVLTREALSDLLEINARASHHRTVAKGGPKAAVSSSLVLPTAVVATPVSGRWTDAAPDTVLSLTPRLDSAAVSGGRHRRKWAELNGAATPTPPPPPPPPSPPPLSSSTLIPPPHPQDVGKLVVVLDLDETLVYSRDITVYERPGVMRLLKALKGKCELIVWTAGTREYALDVIRIIDPVCAVQHCIYRHPMWWTGDVGCAKDLRMLGRPMDRVLLIDNTPSVFRANPRNSLLVEDFIVPHPRAYNAQEKTLSVLTDIFEHVFRRFTSPCAADVLASKRIKRQIVRLERGGCIELNVLALGRSVDAAWSMASRPARLRLAV
ncbi:NLI interacting factor-like phosphatase [Novymonas esmeraldas]|uniref:Mitochondrial import inner membrane translocase subunit TIM50 n=1 Tax=Novymonas esmeraldas TaxID=1808958 RepID=A0AAW0F264_9TRYP